MKTVDTYTANIYVGLRPAYKKVEEHILKSNKLLVTDICQKYCDDVGLGLTLTDTTFIYTDGNEPGVIVGLINYPRFPSSPSQIQETTFKLAYQLLGSLNQERLSIVFSDRTVMIEKEEYETSNGTNRDNTD